jgi:hypothetical protein
MTASLIRSFNDHSLSSSSDWNDTFGFDCKPHIEFHPPSLPETLPMPFVVLVLSTILGLGAGTLKTS